MEMEATGKSKGEWIFPAPFERTVDYLSDQKKILGFNPFCHNVELTDEEDVYRWHFRVTDPQNNPFDVLFYVHQSHELLVALPEELQTLDPAELDDDTISRHTVGRKIKWHHHQLSNPVDDPKNHVFEGKAFADMVMEAMEPEKTKVHFDLRIDVSFVLYPAFRILPEPIIRTMTNAGMSMIMQTATNKMFHSISKDFGGIHHA
ncbi:DUF1997 domain-containing protein [Chlorobium phaeovibrioides]|uniref:DUF1997 domain-containing protein n=2 Tax=Chlorobium phaeovibrioides TaxID=1094 RepID=A0A5M8I9X6_CHLPH|nr:DUF1997 domain-containing protein [Chlorobium phaeovibrioides]KAA6231810.1 DUF1997 domain-containing protein [Chlorobium phaeovibrioides]MWV54165.1 hypothetical protein [Chlorobium phaeovibrioides]QEQ57630.1 DUF1997 domain-containing protein [Chlorobium phaeovibrioides]HCD36799.1 DUF1997 domain-containing protein [Chlorobium sp.]